MAFYSSLSNIVIDFIKSKKGFFTLSDFLENYFSTYHAAVVLQVGAMDGVTSDPLRRHLDNHAGKAVLVEALPYYCKKLEILYSNNESIHICNALVGESEEEQNFYFINPSIADQMDGSGPLNKWAHGQGSLDKQTIIQWIHANKFRGSRYRSNIDKYISAIESISLSSRSLESICKQYSLNRIDLIVIDAQGSEFSILKNLSSFAHKPGVVIYEDDGSMDPLDKTNLEELLHSLGYIHITGNTDKVWINIFPPTTF